MNPSNGDYYLIAVFSVGGSSRRLPVTLPPLLSFLLVPLLAFFSRGIRVKSADSFPVLSSFLCDACASPFSWHRKPLRYIIRKSFDLVRWVCTYFARIKLPHTTIKWKAIYILVSNYVAIKHKSLISMREIWATSALFFIIVPIRIFFNNFISMNVWTRRVGFQMKE